MKKFLLRLPLIVKLVLIGFIPLAFLAYHSAQLFQEKKQRLKLLESYKDRIHQSLEITRLHPKSKYEGTGLGLALCKKIVLRHNGSIHAIGKVNEGAEFIISIPVGPE
jgi:light-regulated signal transduction histidine kinase (bacteriophytochrome)